MHDGLKWVLVAVAVYLGWRFLSGGLSAAGTVRAGYPQAGMSWGGGIGPAAGWYAPAAPNYYGYPGAYQAPWWSGLFANYSQDGGASVGFNGGSTFVAF